jgi:hypothetical protein
VLTHDDQALIEEVAREFVERHGSDAVDVLRENAEIADGIADELSVRSWLDITDAAKCLLGRSGAGAGCLRFVKHRLGTQRPFLAYDALSL